jgi:hypothetical protein
MALYIFEERTGGNRASAVSRVAARTLLACALLFVGAFAATPQSKPRRSTAAPAAKAAPPAPVPAVVPFANGEHLAYRVLWSKYSVNAATLQFLVVEQRDFFGHPSWHFRALGQTVDTMRLVYPLDDQFDSYTDAAKLTSLQFEMYLHEQGKQQNNSWRMSAANDPAPSNATAARVPPETRDPLGLLYALRANDWKTTPEFRAPVFDGNHLYEVVARVEQAADQITVQAGPFTASRIGIQVQEQGQDAAGIHFTLWLAQDPARTPVLIQADIPIGTARVELAARP